MRICVTQKDIDEGVKESCFQCPVALAAIRAGVRFGYSGATVFNAIRFWSTWPSPRKHELRSLTGKVRSFINRFDRNISEDRQHLKPFWFTVEDLPHVEN